MAINTQCGIADETVYGTGVTVDHFYYLESDTVKPVIQKLESASRSSGRIFDQKKNSLPIYIASEGDLIIPAMNRKLQLWLKHMFGACAVTGPTDTAAYTWTTTVATLQGKSFSAQTNRTIHTSGANQAFTWAGGKIHNWVFEAAVQAEAKITATCNFNSETTATALASASYPTDLELMSWASANTALKLGGVAIPATSFKITAANGLKTQDSRFATGEIEPLSNMYRDYLIDFVADFTDLTVYNLFNSTTNTGQYVGAPGLVFKIEAPSLITGCASTKPSLTFTVPAARVDDCIVDNSNMDPTMQNVQLRVRDGGTDPITAVFVSADSTL